MFPSVGRSGPPLLHPPGYGQAFFVLYHAEAADFVKADTHSRTCFAESRRVSAFCPHSHSFPYGSCIQKKPPGFPGGSCACSFSSPAPDRHSSCMPDQCFPALPASAPEKPCFPPPYRIRPAAGASGRLTSFSVCTWLRTRSERCPQAAEAAQKSTAPSDPKKADARWRVRFFILL